MEVVLFAGLSDFFSLDDEDDDESEVEDELSDEPEDESEPDSFLAAAAACFCLLPERVP